jgi:hypothetical protein
VVLDDLVPVDSVCRVISEPEKEATLAVPYRWWTYQQNEMIGLFIGAWAGQPIEAVMVWIAVTYGTTIVYETVKA